MGCQKSKSYWGIFSVALCIALVPFSLVIPKAMAQLSFPRTPPVVGAPGRTVGGGTRGPATCVNGNPTLTVLSPQNNVVTTISTHPTLFWYIPQTQAKSARFVVFDIDNQDQAIYQTTLALKGAPGVVKLNLPRTVRLETGKYYQWELSLDCNPDDSDEAAVVRGWIKPVRLTTQQRNQLAQAKQPLKQAEVYAQAAVWQETISLVAQLRHDRPNDPNVNQAWQDLLKSVRLDAIATKPLVECCKANQ